MKDPQQTEPTPYEILGVPRDATPDAVDRGFRDGLVRRLSVPQLTAAKRVLQDPVERAVLDAFLYDPAFLRSMDPDPARTPEALLPSERRRTSEAWKRLLRERFADPASLHCCAVLWFWDAIVSRASEPAACRQAWHPALAAWTSLVATEAFRARLGPSADTAAKKIEERLRAALRDRQQAETREGRSAEAAVFRGLELELDAELRAARRVAAAGFRVGAGTLACGRLLLEELGLVDSVQGRIDAALRERPGDAALRALRETLFSPLARVESLIAAHDPEGAVRVIEAMPAAEREAPGAQALLAQALHAVGRRLADLDRAEEAIAAWGRALAHDRGDLRGRIESELRALVLSRVAGLQASRRDAAVALIEKALAVVPDLKLQQTLAELLAQRGIDTVNEAMRRFDFEKRSYTEDLVKPFEAGLKDLRDAARLGSERGREQGRVVAAMLARCVRARRRARELEFNAMPPAARKRFAACANGQAKPAPLLVEAARGSGVPAALGALACGAVLLASLLAGFGSGAQPAGAVVFYAGVVFGLVAAALHAVAARVERKTSPYRAGRYLFPLEVVKAEEGGRLVVQPTSGAQGFQPIHHYQAGKYTHTVLTFELKDAARCEFRVAPKARADQVVEELQKAGQAERQAMETGDLAPLRSLDVFPETA